VLGGDERLKIAHKQASRIALSELERFASRQRNTLLQRHSEVTGNICAAAFTHDATRALAAEERQLSQNSLIAYRRSQLRITALRYEDVTRLRSQTASRWQGQCRYCHQ
jgi:hypothetical protein